MLTVLLLCAASSAAVFSPAAAPAPAATAPAATTVVQAAEGEGDARLAEAREHAQAGRRAEAIALLEGLLADGAGDGKEVRLLLADVRLAGAQYQQAVDALTAIEDPDAEVKLATGRAFKAWGDWMASRGAKGDDVGFAYDEARSWLGQAADAAPAGDTRAAVELGMFELYVMGETDAAMDRADALLEQDKGNGEARLLRGCAGLHVALRDADAGDEQAAAVARGRAIEDLVAAAKALPKDRVEPWVQLAWLYEADDQGVKAAQAAAKIVELAPAVDLGTLYHLATRYAGEGKWDAAGEALHAMARLKPQELTDRLRSEDDTDAAARRMGWAAGGLVNAGKLREARDALKPVVAADPQDAEVWNNYAFLSREAQDYQAAYEAYEQALKLNPDDPRLLNDAGLVLHYYLHRDYDRAGELYERAVEQADALLKAGGLQADKRDEVQTARDDAVNNLRKLAAGDYTWP